MVRGIGIALTATGLTGAIGRGVHADGAVVLLAAQLFSSTAGIVLNITRYAGALDADAFAAVIVDATRTTGEGVRIAHRVFRVAP